MCRLKENKWKTLRRKKVKFYFCCFAPKRNEFVKKSKENRLKRIFFVKIKRIKLCIARKL